MKATQHWWMQRLTAILLLPLSYWLIAFLRLALNGNYFEMLEWLALPLNKIALISWFLVVFYHAAIGLQVVIEDYVSQRGYRFAAIWTVHSVFGILGLSAVVLLLQIG
jgi:succinate dehydrogenase / fumarate reductase membrane anchor subunit